MEKEKEKEGDEVEDKGTSLNTLCPLEPSSSFLSQRVKTAIEKPAGRFAKIAHSGLEIVKFPPLS